MQFVQATLILEFSDKVFFNGLSSVIEAELGVHDDMVLSSM